MLIEIDDSDAAIIFAELREPSRPHPPSISRAWQTLGRTIAAEGRRRRLEWVTVDEDLEMAFPSASPPSPELLPQTTRAPSFAPATPSPLIRLLSPLNFVPSPGVSANDTPTPLSPASTLIGSASPDKAPAATPTFEEGGSSSSKRALEQATSPRRSKRLRGAVGGAGDGDDSSGSSEDEEGDFAEARRRRRRRDGRPRSPCPRGGNRVRVDPPAAAHAAASTIGDIQRQLQQELEGEQLEEEGEGEEAGVGEHPEPEEERELELDARGRAQVKGKKLKPAVEKWNTKGPPPTLSAQTSPPIVWLSYITTSPEIQNKLVELLTSLSSTSSDITPQAPAPSTSHSTTLQHLATQCAALENAAAVNDFHQMMSYIDLALHIDHLRRQQKSRKGTDFRALAAQINDPKINQRQLQRWFTAGSRLIYLASSSSMYIIPMFAAAGMKAQICSKYTCKQIQVLAFVLSNPGAPDGTHSLTASCAQLIRTVVIPQMALIKQLTSALNTTFFKLYLPPLSPSAGSSSAVPFSELRTINDRLRAFKVHFYSLPEQDSIWTILAAEMLAPGLAPVLAPLQIDDSCVGEEIKISEREKAANTRQVHSLSELETELSQHHAGGQRRNGSYLCIDTNICEGKVLHIRGQDNKLLALVATNLLDTLPHLQTTLLSQLASIMAGEIYTDKYAEKGHDAPKNVHPHFVRKNGKSRANLGQRVPGASKEIENNPEEAAMLAEMIHLITIIVEHHAKRFLPDDYEELKIYVSQLPLNERSLAYPFGGFVINVSVSTRGHRDHFDKLFCVVIPFGDWTGGELCLFEPGFVFRLRPWDILIFPSCDITHFNLHFEGVRLSLVLHSDKYGDQWVRDGNGWLPNNDEYSDESDE
ncbi:hypothetical protein FB451DRAFT_1548628 [Mycena latifolia]|nr:hypothetical protein FB451DRAFT_1548628 [Mycena latifolia]